MSGLFGIVNADNVDVYLEAAAAKLVHYPWYTINTWIQTGDRPCGLGRVSIGVFNRDPQPYSSANGNLILFFCGELYNTAPLARKLNLETTSDQAELVLAAFQKWDVDFARHLEGAFFIAIYDTVRQRLVLGNDRFGLS